MYRISACLTLCLALSAPAAAESLTLPLPFAEPIQLVAVEIDVRNSRVAIEIDPTRPAEISVSDLSDPPSPHGLAIVSRSNGVLRLQQPRGSEESAPDLDVLVRVGFRHRVEVKGSGVSVTVDGPGGAPPADDEEARAAVAAPGSPSAALLHFDLLDSNVSGRGVGSMAIWGEGSRFNFTDTSGLVHVKGDDHVVELDRHRGSVRALGNGVEIYVAESFGRVDVAGTDAQLGLRAGEGSVDADVTNASVFVEDWLGSLVVKGEENVVELIRSGDDESTAQITCTDCGVDVKEHHGHLNASMIGGRFDAVGIVGSATLSGAEGTAFTVEGAKRSVSLRLEQGAQATVSGLLDGLRANVTDGGRLEASECRDVDAQINNATSELRGLAGRVKVSARDADVGVELARGRQPSVEIAAQGASYVEVSLDSPCIVQVEGGPDALDRVDIAGCESYSTKDEDGRRRRQRRLSGTQMKVSAAASASVSVSAL